MVDHRMIRRWLRFQEELSWACFQRSRSSFWDSAKEFWTMSLRPGACCVTKICFHSHAETYHKDDTRKVDWLDPGCSPLANKVSLRQEPVGVQPIWSIRRSHELCRECTANGSLQFSVSNAPLNAAVSEPKKFLCCFPSQPLFLVWWNNPRSCYQ